MARRSGYSVEVELADPEALPPGQHYTSGGMYTFARPGTIAMADFDGGAFHRAQPVTLDHVQAVLRRVSGVDVTLTALKLATTWTDRACQATRLWIAPGGNFRGYLAQVAEAADEPFMSEIGGLLPIALWGRTVL